MGFAQMVTKIPYLSDATQGPYAINTWSFTNRGVATMGLAAEAMADALNVFFNSTTGTDLPLVSFMSEQLVGNVEVSWREYGDTAGFAERDPFALEELHSNTGSSMPLQCAVCLTEKGDIPAGWKRQSAYNRQYIGPLNTNALAANGQVSVEFQASVINAAAALQNSLDDFGVDTAEWVIYSPKHDTGIPIVDIWVDDRWDIQRRRAQEVTNTRHI